MEPPAQPRQGGGPPQGVLGLSFPARIVVAVATGVLAVLGAVHLLMIFLHVAPSNTLTKQHGSAVDEYVYPEFEQNWKLFAPNPLQQNIAVHARAEVLTPDGTTERTGWVNLSAMDGEGIRGNPFPSHTLQNELRRAWDFYTGSHDAENRSNGLRGELSEEYVRRIVMLRFGAELNGGEVRRVQVRSATTPVAPPPWSNEKIDIETTYRVLPWWPVSRSDVPEGK